MRLRVAMIALLSLALLGNANAQGVPQPLDE